MNKYICYLFLFCSSSSMACSFIGATPSVDDLIRKFEQHYERSEEIWRVTVESIESGQAKFKILEVYKSERDVGNEFVYGPGTSCDEFFEKPGGEYIIFARWSRDRLYISLANAMSREYYRYSKLQKMLKGRET